MSESKVSNTKAEILPSEDVFNDRDRINDLLISYKHLAYMYSLAAQEASNSELYKQFFQLFEETSQLQRDTYDLMFEKGWYALEKQTPEKIEKLYEMFHKQQKQLEN